MKDTKFAYGNAFQIKLISAILTDQTYYSQYFDIIDVNYFDSQPLCAIYNIILKYYLQYKTIPTFQVVGININDIKNQNIQQASFQQMKHIYMSMKDKDLQFVKDKTASFCKNQKLKQAIMQASELINSQDYDKIRHLIDKALQAGDKCNTYVDYVQNFEKRYAPDQRKTVETPWPLITELMNGGLGRRQIGVIVASAGVGKSWLLTAIGAHALKLGKKVAHIGLQLTQEYTLQRYDSVLSGIYFADLINNKQKVKNQIEKYEDCLKVQNFAANTVSTDKLRTTIQLMKARGFNPDIIIIDYADLLLQNIGTARKSNNGYEQSGNVYLQMRALAFQFQIPIWSATQASRCICLNSIVNVEGKGQIKISQLKQNDKILTPDGYKNVNAIYPIQRKPTYKIKLKNGQQIYCSAEHKFPTKYGVLKSIQSGLSVKDSLFVEK